MIYRFWEISFDDRPIKDLKCFTFFWQSKGKTSVATATTAPFYTGKNHLYSHLKGSCKNLL